MKRIFASLLLPALVACDTPITTPSGNVGNTSMYASIFGVDDGSSTTVITQLRTASNINWPDITLDSGDTLYASNVGTTTDINRGGSSFGSAAQISEGLKKLEQRDMVINDFLQTTVTAPEYATVFPQTNSAGTTYYLNFERSNYDSVENVPIAIASPFQPSTSLPGSISRSQNLTATWTPSSDSTETMSYQTVWFCDDPNGTTGFTDPAPIPGSSTSDPGSINISQPSGISTLNASCTVTLVIYRQKLNVQSALNSGFGLGATIKGVQRRHLNFISTYP
jgi:hypothetical protein